MKDNVNKEQNQRYTGLGAFVMGVMWILYALKWITVVSVIALPVLWLMHKPLWIAPIIGVIGYVIFRIFWRLFWRFIRWSEKK